LPDHLADFLLCIPAGSLGCLEVRPGFAGTPSLALGGFIDGGENLDAEHAVLARAEAAQMDPHSCCSWRRSGALQDAGLDPQALRGQLSVLPTHQVSRDEWGVAKTPPPVFVIPLASGLRNGRPPVASGNRAAASQMRSPASPARRGK
jgi:hypothetical protein